ncbi:MFS transporter [Latilactobacillus fuchuensis]|uniref:Glycoside-Pentoside-hexuronide (GPH) cation symporter family protein n=1 Tax=Latilactobacillus fuchuensis DSM 14340 = JCM 11249 TaxID=1423747 RepID=A0A0R1RV32_9LACO|nr:MFS transporter [Latilactobacillus fuchuensis]KRL59172.1 glycoside-Pentoside-hexuronide (GPH) cation symporter family protein [Latilactobacillus fuchuensis DSM 14340 = JCM 11249]
MAKKVVTLKRLIPGLIIGPASWLGPYIVMNSLFLPALIQHLDAANKIQLVALFSTCGMVVAAISNMLAGALSDKTRSRFGQRTPWLIGGSFVFMLAMIAASMAPTITLLLAAWMVGQAALNFIVAPMVAWIDLAPKDSRDTASSAYGGLGMALGNNAFNVVGAMLLGQFRLGFMIFGIITFVGTLIAAAIVREPSNLDDAIVHKDTTKKLSLKDAAAIFPSWHVGRDYYLALIGKLFQGVGNFAITGYILYIMTDFLHMGSQTQSSIQLINIIMLVFGILMGFIAGPISDKFKVLKYPVAFSTLFLAFGALMLFFFRNNTGIIVYAFAAGIGMGVWNSLDNLLNIEVIPDENRVAFFLGVYNLGNTITQAIAPVLAAVVISWFGFSAIFIVSFLFSLVGGIAMLCIKSVKR